MGTIERTFEFGDILVVTEGIHSGKIGHYDDDDAGDRLVLYPTPPPKGARPYIMVSHRKVRKATPGEIAEYKHQTATFFGYAI